MSGRGLNIVLSFGVAGGVHLSDYVFTLGGYGGLIKLDVD